MFHWIRHHSRGGGHKLLLTCWGRVCVVGYLNVTWPLIFCFPEFASLAKIGHSVTLTGHRRRDFPPVIPSFSSKLGGSKNKKKQIFLLQTTFLWFVSDVCVTTINLPVFGGEQEAWNFLLCSWVTACFSRAAAAAVKLNNNSGSWSSESVSESNSTFSVTDVTLLTVQKTSSVKTRPFTSNPAVPVELMVGCRVKLGSHSVNFHERPKMKKKQLPPFWDTNRR